MCTAAALIYARRAGRLHCMASHRKKDVQACVRVQNPRLLQLGDYVGHLCRYCAETLCFKDTGRLSVMTRVLQGW